MVPKGVATKDKIRYTSVGWANSPEYVAPLSEESEKIILTSLVLELRENFGVKISSNLNMSRNRTGVGSATRYLLVGGRNSGILGDMLESIGRKVDKACIKGWRPTKNGVKEMAEQLEKKVTKDSVVIFMGLDNGLYYAEDDDGERTLPKKDKEGKYHVAGQVQLASCKHARNMINNCTQLWEILADLKKVIGGPLVRYFRISCCELSSHCTNLGLPGYRRGILSDLADIKESIRDECTAMGMKNFKVVSLCDLMGIHGSVEEDEAARLLGEDPVHPSAEGFAVLAEKLINIIESENVTYLGEKRELDNSLPDGEEMGSWRRKNLEWLFFGVSGTGRWQGRKKYEEQKRKEDKQGRYKSDKGQRALLY